MHKASAFSYLKACGEKITICAKKQKNLRKIRIWAIKNPAKASTTAPGRLRFLKPEEIKRFLMSVALPLRPIVVTAQNTGMRKDDILNLKWDDVDLINRRITLVNTKNNKMRTIPINETLFQELASLIENCQTTTMYSAML